MRPLGRVPLVTSEVSRIFAGSDHSDGGDSVTKFVERGLGLKLQYVCVPPYKQLAQPYTLRGSAFEDMTTQVSTNPEPLLYLSQGFSTSSPVTCISRGTMST